MLISSKSSAVLTSNVALASNISSVWSKAIAQLPMVESRLNVYTYSPDPLTSFVTYSPFDISLNVPSPSISVFSLKFDKYVSIGTSTYT